MSIKAPEIRRFACQVSRSLDKRRERRHTVANEVVGLYQNRPVDDRQPRIGMVDFHLRATAQAAASLKEQGES